MNTILSIFRWLLGIFFGLGMMAAVIALVPMSVAGKQLFQRESGMAWLTTLTEDDKAMEAFIEGFFNSLATSDQIDDPKMQEVFKYAANKNSPLGAASRKVFSKESVGENLLTNAATIYDWLEEKTDTVVITYKFGGTASDQNALVAEFLRLEYEARPVCTTAELAGFNQRDPTSIVDLGCSVGPLSDSTFKVIAAALLKEPEVKELITKGVEYDLGATVESRKGMLALEKMLGAGVIVAWILLGIATLFMILLFVPRGVNYIASGMFVGITGLAVGSIGIGLSAAAPVLQETLGNEISLHGLLIGVAGLALVVLGIVLLARGGTSEEINKKPQAKKTV